MRTSKRHALNGLSEAEGGTTATSSLPRPEDFPVGSVESRAAARLVVQQGGLRENDEGVTEEGHPYFVFKDPKTHQLMKIIMDVRTEPRNKKGETLLPNLEPPAH